MVVAEFIVQSESAESILEAINIIKQWNPAWNPKFFLCDYSDAEIAAIEQAFPGILVYLCDFLTASRLGHDGFTIGNMVFLPMMENLFFPCSENVLGLHLERMERTVIITTSST